MSQNLQNIAKFQKIQLDNLVDFEICCKTPIHLQKSVPIQPNTSQIVFFFFLFYVPENAKFTQIIPNVVRVHIERDMPTDLVEFRGCFPS